MQAQIEVVPSTPALISKVLKELPRDRKKEKEEEKKKRKKKHTKYSGNITFDEIVNIFLQRWH